MHYRDLGRDQVADETIRRVKAFFKERCPYHQPTDQMYEALRAIPLTVVDILTDKAAPAYHISPLAAGLGKTTTLMKTIETIRWLTGNAVGVVIAAGRYEQIKTLILEMELSEDVYACYVSEDTEVGAELAQRGLGKDRVNEAPILFSTHAMIESRLTRARPSRLFPDTEDARVNLDYQETQERTWSDTKEFFYRDQPRLLRCWDETLPPSIPTTGSVSTFVNVMSALEGTKVWRKAWDAIGELSKLKGGEQWSVPNFTADMSRAEALHLAGDLSNPHHRDAISRLWSLSGRTARIRQDGATGAANTALDFEGRLPDDLKPMLVMDASANHSVLYTHQGKATKDVVILPDAQKRFDDVTIHATRGPSGRHAYKKAFHKRIKEIAKIINDSPSNSCLIVHHKESARLRLPDTRKAVEDLVLPDRNPAFLTWGAHNAINDHRDRSVIIIPSVLRLPPSTYEALGRGALLRDGKEDYSEDEFRQVEKGEIKAELYQAINRGSIRKSKDGAAYPCDIYVWTDVKSPTAEWLTELFPGAKVVLGGLEVKGANTIYPPMVDKVWTVIEKFFADLENDADLGMSYPELCQSSGVSGRNLSRTLSHPEMRERLKAGRFVTQNSRPKRLVQL